MLFSLYCIYCQNGASRTTLLVDAHDYGVLNEDELLSLAVFFSRRSVLRSLPIFTSCSDVICHARVQ